MQMCFQPKYPIFPPNSVEGLQFSAFHYFIFVTKLRTKRNDYIRNVIILFLLQSYVRNIVITYVTSFYFCYKVTYVT